MIDYARQRQAMVEGQVHVNDVTDPRILAAMGELPREKFVPAARAELAYVDEDIPLRASIAGKPRLDTLGSSSKDSRGALFA